MKRVAMLLPVLVGLLVCGIRVGAEGPDDEFIRVYNLIQQADALKENGQPRAAQAKYLEARAALLKLEASHPSWNPKIVQYRKGYIAERLGPLAGAAPPAQPAPGTPPGPATTPAPGKPPGDERDRQIQALTQEIAGLRNARDLLEAKLREALTAQPAAADPRELAKAEERIRGLEKDNALLKTDLAQQKDRLAKTADPALLAQAQKALEDANRSLAAQTRQVAALTKDNQNLEDRLKKQNEKTDAKTKREAEKARPATPGGIPGDAALTDLRRKLDQAQRELAEQQTRAEALRAEKATLEKRVTELAQRPAAAAAAPKLALPPESKPPTKAERAELKRLEQERNDLQKKVALLTGQLEDRKLRKGAAQTEQLTDQLAILRARLEVYEARKVPYSPEEMALFKESAPVSAPAEVKLAKKAPRQPPPAAALLMADARRAFEARRLEEAETKFQAALTLDEKNLVVLTDLAATELEAGHLEAADATLKRALAEDAADGQALSLLGLLRYKQQRIDEAQDVLGRAAQLDPNNPVTQNYLGITLSQKGQRGPAETAFRKAIQLQPAYGEAHNNLAVVYATQAPPFYQLARWHYEKALAAGHPKQPDLEKLLERGLTAGK